MAAKMQSVPKWMDPVLKGKKKPKSKQKSTLQKQMDEVFKADKVLPNRDEREPAREEKNPVPILDTDVEAPPILESESPILTRKVEEKTEVVQPSEFGEKISELFTLSGVAPRVDQPPKSDVPLKDRIESLFTLSKRTQDLPEQRPVPPLQRLPEENSEFAIYRNVRDSLKKLVSLCLSKDDIAAVVQYAEWLKQINDKCETSKPILGSPKPWPVKKRLRSTIMPSDINPLIVDNVDSFRGSDFGTFVEKKDADGSSPPPQST